MGEPIPPRVFTSTYFDTAHHRLGQLGLTLRKRVEHSRGIWQLKIPSGAARLELEIDSGSRDIPWEFYDLLTAFFRKQEAIQLGKLRTKRIGVHVLNENRVIAEVVQDSVAFMSDKKVIRTFREIEVELQEGTETQLKSIRKVLIHAGAEEKPLQAKIFQALQLPYPLPCEFSESSAPPTEHIRERLHSQFLQILRHDPGTRLGRDSEAVHQMRVATRRIRAIIRAGAFFSSARMDGTRSAWRWGGLAPCWARSEIGMSSLGVFGKIFMTSLHMNSVHSNRFSTNLTIRGLWPVQSLLRDYAATVISISWIMLRIPLPIYHFNRLPSPLRTWRKKPFTNLRIL